MAAAAMQQSGGSSVTEFLLCGRNAWCLTAYRAIMEHMEWTDNRLQDRFDSIDRRFDEVDRRFDRLEREIIELRREVRSEIAAMRGALNRVGGGIFVGLVGVIGAILINGGGA